MTKDLHGELWRVPTPIPRPVLTAAGPYDTYFHLVVVMQGNGHVGWGYSGLATEALLDDACRFAKDILGRVSALANALSIEQYGYDTASRGATSAISLAGWDLAGRLLGMATADFWGRRPGVDALDAYASGFFLDASPEEIYAEAHRARRDGFRRVKMRVGLTGDQDVARYNIIRDVFPEPRAIAIDAFHSWNAQQARAFVDAVGDDLLWVEDATSYDTMSDIGPYTSMLASGESLETTAELLDLLRDASLGATLLDVQRLGGPRAWLDASAALTAAGARIGGHVYTPYTTHLLACVENPLPVEVFDWSNALFAVPLVPNVEGQIPVLGPGFGVELAPDALGRYGTRIL